MQDDKRYSSNSFATRKSSLHTSIISLDLKTVTPPPVHFTTTIHDPPMPKRRDSSHFTSSQYYQKNFNFPSGTNYSENYNEINNNNLEGNWSLLDNISLYN